jgi:hypothetical protein
MIFLVFTDVVSVGVSDVDAQLLSGQQRNDSTTGPAAREDSSGGGLLSILQGPGISSGNLTSVADTMFQGVEERIDTRLESIRMKMDETAAAVLPAITAAAVGIVALAALIVAYIIFSWYYRFKQARNHKKALRSMYGLILGELNDNAELLSRRTSLTKSNHAQDEGKVESMDQSSHNQSNPEIFAPSELSNQALGAVMASPFYWNLTSEIQHVIVKLFRAANGHNKILGRSLSLKDSVILNKLDEQTAIKVLSEYETALHKNTQDVSQLSKKLQELIQKETSRDVLFVFRKGQTDVKEKPK